jgi:hypothetical protein
LEPVFLSTWQHEGSNLSLQLFGFLWYLFRDVRGRRELEDLEEVLKNLGGGADQAFFILGDGLPGNYTPELLGQVLEAQTGS